MASPSYKHGNRSEYLPARLRARYEEALNDADLLAIRAGMALLAARLADLLERADTGGAGQLWEDLEDA